jgi:ribosomal peptide maturation radical SAM protein 1
MEHHQSTDFGLDICFAVPPFHPVHFPALGASMLKRACEARGLSARVVYGGFTLAALTGYEPYERLSSAIQYPKIGERLFRAHAYPPETVARLPTLEPLTDDQQALYDGIADSVAPGLDAFVKQVLALRPRILGIASTFEQNLASAALARHVKAKAPEICIVLGGANAGWPMARGLADVFPWIDYIFAGESDVDFPNFCERAIRHGEWPADRIIRSEPISDMRTVSAPDYSDYFAALRPLQAAGTLPDWLPRYVTMENSRGCWWGAKHHCTFCGLNKDGMGFRSKPAERVQRELAEVAGLGVDLVWNTDNIMPLGYFTDLLPALAKTGPHLQLFYEVKSNLTEQQVDVMALAGISCIQPGIESLSSNVLTLMRKGVSAHQNIALLRSCAGVGTWVIWNMLYAFPGESAADYESMVGLMPRLAHLQPPTGAHRIVIDRFSPNFDESEAMGIGPIEPLRSYYALYPPEAAVTDIAYHFFGDYSTDLLRQPDVLERLKEGIAEWQRAWEHNAHPVLQLFEAGTSTFIIDTRPIARAATTRLSADQLATLLHFERAHPRAGLDPALGATVAWLLEHNFLIEHEGKLMSVVVRPRAAIVERIAGWTAGAPARLRFSAEQFSRDVPQAEPVLAQPRRPRDQMVSAGASVRSRRTVATTSGSAP